MTAEEKLADLKEVYLRRIRSANHTIDDEGTDEVLRQRLRIKVSVYKYFIIELER